MFLTMAEKDKGEIDGIIMPFGQYKNTQEAGWNQKLTLNMTRIDELYGRKRFLLSPRKIINEVRI